MSRKTAFLTYLSLKNAEFLHMFILMRFKTSISIELNMKKVL